MTGYTQHQLDFQAQTRLKLSAIAALRLVLGEADQFGRPPELPYPKNDPDTIDEIEKILSAHAESGPPPYSRPFAARANAALAIIRLLKN